MAGWIKLHRELTEKPIWICSTTEQKVILITLLMMANHKHKEWEWKGQKYTCAPGQFITSLESIAAKSGKDVSIRNVRTALSRFEKLNFLTSEVTNKNRLLTIVNWDVYQNMEADADKQTDKQVTSDRQASDKQVTTTKECNNDNNDKKVIYRKIEKLEITVEEVEKLKIEYTIQEIDDVLDRIENYKKRDQYKSLYLTAKNWLKADKRKNNQSAPFSSTTQDPSRDHLKRKKF